MSTAMEERKLIQKRIIEALRIIPHDAWSKKTPKKPLAPDWNFKSIAIHHSGNFGRKDPLEVEELHHRGKYDDIGYHYLIHPDGRIWEGRPIIYKGEHVGGANTGKIGILMMGDYDHQWYDWDDDLGKTQLAKLELLIKILKMYFPITQLGGHKEYLPGKGYECPGNVLMAVIPALRSKFALHAP